MSSMVQLGKPARAMAIEITAALAGRRIGLCGYDVTETRRISEILYGARALPIPFEERLLGEVANICDAMVLKLSGVRPEGMRAAAASPAAVMVSGDGEAFLSGEAGVYAWPTGFIIEPWTEAELIVRMFRLLQSPRGSLATSLWDSRTEPLVLLADDDPELTELVEVTMRNDG